MTILDELVRRISYLKDIGFDDAPARYTAFLDWLESQPATNRVLAELRSATNVDKIFKDCSPHNSPSAGTPEEVARVGLYFFEFCKSDGQNLPGLLIGIGLESKWGGSNFDGYFASAIDRYIQPFINYLVHEVEIRHEQLTADDVATFRLNMILSEDFSGRFPKTAGALKKLSKEFFARPFGELVQRRKFMPRAAETLRAGALRRPWRRHA